FPSLPWPAGYSFRTGWTTTRARRALCAESFSPPRSSSSWPRSATRRKLPRLRLPPDFPRWPPWCWAPPSGWSWPTRPWPFSETPWQGGCRHGPCVPLLRASSRRWASECSRSDSAGHYYDVADYTDPWKNAPAILLQHGYARSSFFWTAWIPYLARFYRVIR